MDIGEGLNSAFEKMKEWKLRPPVIEEKDNYVVVTIPHIPLARPSEIILKFLERVLGLEGPASVWRLC